MKYLNVAGEVKEVVTVWEILIDLIRKVLNRVLVGNVLDHERRSGVITDIERINIENIWIVVSYLTLSQGILRCCNGIMVDISIRVRTDHYPRPRVWVTIVARIPINGTGMAEIFPIRAVGAGAFGKRLMQQFGFLPLLLIRHLSLGLFDFRPNTSQSVFLNLHQDLIGCR